MSLHTLQTAASQATRRILVVEDTPICREPLVSALRLKGFETTGAEDGRKALELIASTRPDLVLLDIVMPQMDGWEVLRLLRNNPKHADLPVILLTSTVDRELIARARALGVCDYLLKGQFSMTELFARVQKYLDPIPDPAVSSVAAPTTLVRPPPSAEEPTTAKV